MVDVDEEALLLNIACGTDLPTSLAGSIIDKPAPARRKPGLALWIVVAIGLALGWFIASSL